mmetsp:Transcript_13453/g.31636  ORF Transcript_13453/g.31636 Transcript_13453/m.31636 type:complete len:325 (-) Transcript_13453:45-1019(-)
MAASSSSSCPGALDRIDLLIFEVLQLWGSSLVPSEQSLALLSDVRQQGDTIPMDILKTRLPRIRLLAATMRIQTQLESLLNTAVPHGPQHASFVGHVRAVSAAVAKSLGAAWSQPGIQPGCEEMAALKRGDYPEVLIALSNRFIVLAAQEEEAPSGFAAVGDSANSLLKRRRTAPQAGVGSAAAELIAAVQLVNEKAMPKPKGVQESSAALRTMPSTSTLRASSSKVIVKREVTQDLGSAETSNLLFGPQELEIHDPCHRRSRWTDEEEQRLVNAWLKFGARWEDLRMKANLRHRSGAQLKDKIRNLAKANHPDVIRALSTGNR